MSFGYIAVSKKVISNIFLLRLAVLHTLSLVHVCFDSNRHCKAKWIATRHQKKTFLNNWNVEKRYQKFILKLRYFFMGKLYSVFQKYVGNVGYISIYIKENSKIKKNNTLFLNRPVNRLISSEEISSNFICYSSFHLRVL